MRLRVLCCSARLITPSSLTSSAERFILEMNWSGSVIKRSGTCAYSELSMPIENEPISAEKIRRKKLVTVLGKCLDCGQPVKEGQEFSRSDDGIRHKLCAPSLSVSVN
jgi:hypothetical protein